MRPIKGMVVGRNTVRCENGVTVTADIPEGVKWYDPVDVYYDFTTSTVRKVMPTKDEHDTEGDMITPPEEDDTAQGEDDDPGMCLSGVL